MFKRLLISFLAIIAVYSSIVVVYTACLPEMTTDTNVIMEDVLNYDSLKDYTLAGGDAAIHYYFFGSKKNDDSIYVGNTILKEAENRTGLTLTKLIEFVDITELEDTLTTNKLKSDWGISNYPAFAAVSVNDGQIIIDNVLESDLEHPISVDNFINWLKQNGVYTDE